MLKLGTSRRPGFEGCVVLVLVGLVAGAAWDTVPACTIVVKADSRSILVGNNEDYLEPRTKVWFLPAEGQRLGRMIWGYDRYLYPYQGGMNEKGLFIDINAVGQTGWKDDPELPNFEGDVVDHVLSACSTVDEAVQFFRTHDNYLDFVKYVIADEHGHSATVEWEGGRLNIIPRVGSHQVSTNYLSPREHEEPRNRIATAILASQEEATVDLVRRVLSATSFDVYFNQTLYSTICDLKKRRVFLYHFHNFEEVVTFDLPEELAKGAAQHAIPSLFTIRPYHEIFFQRNTTKLGAEDLMRVIQAEGIEAGLVKFWNMKEETRSFKRYIFEEWLIRSIGLSYLAEEKTDEALAIFKLNQELYPDSWEVYKDMGDAQRKSGRRTEAIRSYEKALQLNPDVQGVARVLEAIRSGKEEPSSR